MGGNEKGLGIPFNMLQPFIPWHPQKLGQIALDIIGYGELGFKIGVNKKGTVISDDLGGGGYQFLEGQRSDKFVRVRFAMVIHFCRFFDER